ncbi:unnamed protein product [Linum trigynum]|uniref:Uncharacterized protein n=1 Tax=Linum trigynum TaxID=586398 RepID=A0AAV2FSE1_9ROSI
MNANRESTEAGGSPAQNFPISATVTWSPHQLRVNTRCSFRFARQTRFTDANPDYPFRPIRRERRRRSAFL